ncbi:MAG: Mur ligase family protein [Patescibacteria group bacterium]
MIKKILRKLVIWCLELEARLILKKYRPRLVGITGSVGKTSVKEAVYLILAGRFKTARSEKSFNGEIGVPLSILRRPNAWGRPLDWLKNFAAGLNLIIFRHDYPEWLVLELGVDRPGDIKRFNRWLKLDLAILTGLPARPVHLEFFPSPEDLAKEKLSLFEAVRADGWLVVNGDDERIITPTNYKVVTYGFGENNVIRIHSEHLIYDDAGPVGYTFKIDHAGHTVPLRLNGLFGRHQLYAPAAGLAVGVALGFNLVEMTEALTAYEPPPGRLRLLRGIKDSLLLDDSYNSSPAAVELALETLKLINVSGRRIAVLGDMLELGQYTIEAHQEVGRQAAAVCDIIMTIGVRAKFIADAARNNGFDPKNLFHFDEAQEAGRALEHLLAPGDLVLVKGSQSIRTERVVEEVMAEPERKTELLVRQEKEWQER